jgi:hypothetical protein
MIILDEHLQGLSLETEISRWYRGRVFIVKQLRPGTIIKDDVIPILLYQTKQPTFVTINYTDFWRRVSADERYCIVCLQLSTSRADEIPSLLRRLFRLPGFKTKAERMGKVVLLNPQWVRYYQVPENQIHLIGWPF